MAERTSSRPVSIWLQTQVMLTVISRRMNILLTSDLHLNIPERSRRTGHTTFSAFAESIARENPDAVVVAGDIGIPDKAGEHLVALRRVVGNRPLAFCVGNHDLWVSPGRHGEFGAIVDVVARFWREPAGDVGAVLLDEENADFGDVIISGGYGHFDLGHAIPNLCVGGMLVTERIYLSGGMGGLRWRDFEYIPNCGSRLQADAREQAKSIAIRLDQAIATGKRVLATMHTCPWPELNGHPASGNVTDILAAYGGNSLLGAELEKSAASIEWLMCGHTHMPVRERILHGTRALNVGTDYGYYRGVIYDTDDHSVRWVGEPIA